MLNKETTEHSTIQPVEEKGSGFTMNDSNIWNIFTAEPMTGVALVTVQGDVLYVNQQCIDFFMEDMKPEMLIGKNLSDISLDEDMTKDRLKLYEQIRQTGQSVLLRSIWKGKQIFNWMNLIPADEHCDQDRILLVIRHVEGPDAGELLDNGDYQFVESDEIDLGSLSVLTPRELEVLAMIGQGLAIKEIAKSLFRSVKTIENHREAIGRKLEQTKGVGLVLLAHAAGLKVEDSSRKRIGDH
jgi:DNA-binding CsgD family transcriptional regulator